MSATSSDRPTPERAAELLAAALELAEAERGRFLAECGASDVLRREVLALLAAHGAAGDFMGADFAPTSALPERAGHEIGRYRLVQELGEGGFGTVWLAEQLAPVARAVALKILKAGMDTREVIARFESERQALALMEHEHIARVFDAGATETGRPYFVMELVRGAPITQHCDEAGLDTAGRLALFADVCAAISHAHQKGVIHRDIKPSNVLVTRVGERAVVKVIDFGIAKATQGRLTAQTLTRAEQFVGTPAYMSPEQAQRGGLDVDTRSDVYSLGALLYELVAGRPPFDGQALAAADVAEVRRILGEVEPPRPSVRLRTTAGEERLRLARARRIEPAELPRLVEPDLDWIVMKALEKDRTRRYQTVQDLAQDVANFLADAPVNARPPSRAYLFRKFARRHRAALRVGAGFLLLLLAATAVSTWQAVRARLAEQRALGSEAAAQVETVRARAQRLRADAEAERAQQQLYEAHMLLGLQTWREHRGLRALRELLARWTPTDGAPDRRRWEWRYLQALPQRNVRALRPVGRRAGASALAWHAGRGWLAEGTAAGEVRVWSEAGGAAAETLPGRVVPALRWWGGRWLAWDPAGTRLAAAGQDGAVRIWEFVGASRESRTLAARGGALRGVAFSADGRRLAAWAETGWVTVWDVATGRVEAEIVHPGEVTSAAWSPDDRTLAVGHSDGTVTFSATQTGAPLTTLAAQTDLVADLAWSPDGTRLATSGANEFATGVWEVATQRRVLGPLRHSHGITSLAWEPGGRRLASGSMDETVRIWDTASGREEVVLRGLEDSVTALAWGPGGQLAAGGGFGALQVWTSLHDQEWDVLPGDGRRVTAVAWNPADGRLAAAGDDGCIRLWQPPAGRADRRIVAHAEKDGSPQFGLIRALAWSPDGRRIASAGFDGVTRVWLAETGQELFALREPAGVHWCVAWSPDGGTLAVGAEDGVVRLVTGFPDRPAVRRWAAHAPGDPDQESRRGVRCLAWSPRGDRLASGGWDGVARIWDPAATQPVELHLLREHDGGVLSLAWSPDGAQLVTGGTDFLMHLWDARTGQRLRAFRGHNDFVEAVRWSADGTRLASAGLDNTVRLWDPRTGRETFVLRGKAGVFHDLAWSRDGEQLAAAGSDGDVWIWRTR